MYLYYSLLFFLIITSILWILFLVKSGLKMVLASAISGLLLLIILKILEAYHGLFVPINFITLLFSSFLGVPGTIGILTIIFLFF